MCDYSLHGIKNRLANEGEHLFVHKFHTGSKGLASVTDLKNLEKPAPAPAGAFSPEPRRSSSPTPKAT